MRRKNFRAGTIVSFRDSEHIIYGVVLKRKTTRYSVLAVYGGRRHLGGKWSVQPYEMTYIAPGRAPDEVHIAIAKHILTKGDLHG